MFLSVTSKKNGGNRLPNLSDTLSASVENTHLDRLNIASIFFTTFKDPLAVKMKKTSRIRELGFYIFSSKE